MENKKPQRPAENKESSSVKAASSADLRFAEGFGKARVVSATEAESADKKATASQEEFKKQLEECEKKAAEYLSGWQRERADFLNYKKEEMERIGQLINYAREEFILEILPLMDNFEIIARQNFLSENLSGQEKERIEKIIQGINQIKIQFQDFLKSLGVEEIKSIGDSPSHKASDEQWKFDPRYMEAVEEVEIKGMEPGTIVEEIQKGYKSNGRLLRPARVKVVK